ncbi:MAG: hypothetical protein LC100_01805 [Chitinophagales bacterium]|nr:hypothetical protein [Chitinophagales bacterium]
MTRADFYDWLIAKGCTIEPLTPGTRGNVIKIKSPRSNSYVYYNTPIDDRPVKCYSVCNICHQLYVDVPEECKKFEELATFIKNKHYPNK